jgi:hypothetical protein
VSEAEQAAVDEVRATLDATAGSSDG